MTDPTIRQADVFIEVLFCDVDALDVVYHANYFRFFEAARTALLRGIDYDYPEMQRSGYKWPIIECKCRFMRPIVYGQWIRVVARLTEFENRLKINYEIYDADQRRLAKGHTVQVAVDGATGEMCYESPAVLRRKLEQVP